MCSIPLPLLQVAGERTSLTCSALRLLIFLGDVQDKHMDSTEAIRAAADSLVSSNALWSHGRILLQTASCAAMLYNGVLCCVWRDKVSHTQ